MPAIEATVPRVSRAVLRAAIEAGIQAAKFLDDSFGDDEATLLRGVAAEAKMVAIGSYIVLTDDGGEVGCPVAQAFPDYATRSYRLREQLCAQSYDRAMRDAGFLLDEIVEVSS